MASKKKTARPAPKKKTKRDRKKKTSGTQLLPGVVDAEEAEKIEELDKAGLDYVDRRDAWTTKAKQAATAKEKLLSLMREHGKTHYFNPEASLRIKIEHGEDKLSVLVGEKALGNEE